jgi:ribosomal protein L40E
MMADMLTCERCGGTSPLDARFCIDCGESLTTATIGPTTRLGGITCPSCHANNPENARFCVVCGRSFTVTPPPAPARPTPRPTAAPPRPSAAPPSYTYPRVATPQTLSSARTYPPQTRRHHSQHNEPGALIFVIGLVVLLANHTLWPGLLILIGLSLFVNQIASGRADRGMRTMLWLGGLALLFATGTFWPGLIILFVLQAVMGKRGYW